MALYLKLAGVVLSIRVVIDVLGVSLVPDCRIKMKFMHVDELEKQVEFKSEQKIVSEEDTMIELPRVANIRSDLRMKRKSFEIES
eukprot:g69122.t1